MRILVDEDLVSDELMARLRKAGHHVESPRKGALDPAVWIYAQEHALLLLTRNGPDFLDLAAVDPRHHGALFVHGERDETKNMLPSEIAAAVAFVREIHGDDLAGQIVILNAWRRSRTT